MSIADYLRRKRCSQARFAKEVGVSQSMVAQWIGGERPISARAALRIDAATGGELSKQLLRPDLWAEPRA